MNRIERTRLQTDLTGLRFQLALVRRDLIELKYSPDQPRIPAGLSGGGRWTASVGGGAGAAVEPPPFFHDAVLRPEDRDTYRLDATAASPPPRVDLAAEERQGGHAIRHAHVAVPNAALVRQLASERLDMPAVSILNPAHGAFNDLASANSYVNDVLAANPAEVEAVASGQIRAATLIRRYGAPTGREAYRATKGLNAAILIRPTFHVWVKIKHTGTGKGFVVTTAFPRNKDADY